jgi:hypothetical protein
MAAAWASVLDTHFNVCCPPLLALKGFRGDAAFMGR